ncbi:MAG TPA: hypothetical protein VGO86_05170 [Candidatus Dormibacteraeota bacterium]
MNRVLRYLGSGKNIAGSGLALGGLGLHFAGVVGGVWPFVVPALYLIGALVMPSRRERPVEPIDRFDPAKIQRALDGTLDMARGRVPADVIAQLTSIRQHVLEILPHGTDLPGGSQDLYVLQRTATDYVPTTMRIYLALPVAYATTEVVQDGKTSLQVLKDQLALLDAQMADIGDAVRRRDSDRLLAQGRFLEERFGRGSPELTIPKPPPP